MVKIIDNYTLTDYLGKGEYGKVYKATNIDTKINVAVKMIPLKKFQELNKLTELTKNEIEILRLLQNNINVINFVEMIKTNNYIYLVYQYCEEGTLEDFIRQRSKIPQREALRIFKQIINAFRSLNQYNILHRDVKPNNIFFKSGHLKLADFGFSKKLKNNDDLTQTSLGSPLYMAPEVLNGDVYGSKADVWSVGIVLYEMLFGHCPFGDCNIKQLVNIYSGQKMKVDIPGDKIMLSPIAESMLRRMLEKDQFKRISWQDFFYEYTIDEYGSIKRKEKDFEYDLMKLMKKNTSLHESGKKVVERSSFKFDWSKITQKNSSVHSEQLNIQKTATQQNIDQIFNLKKKVKQFQIEHSKGLQISLIIELMLESTEDIYYSDVVCYFLIYNLQNIVKSNMRELENFMKENQSILRQNPSESNTLNKMVVVFRNQATTLNTKMNSIKVNLMNSEDVNIKILKYPENNVLKRQMNKYIKNFENKYKGITNLGLRNYTGTREEVIYLIKVLWGVNTIKVNKKDKELNFLAIKPQSTNGELSKFLNKLIVSINT